LSDVKIEEKIKEAGLPILEDEKTGAQQWFDVRELRLKYIISVEKTKQFFEGLKQGKLLATKCKNCGRIFFPPQVDCPSCLRSDIEWIELKGEGTIETLTVIFVKPPSFNHFDPYTVAIARLDEGPRILAWLRGDPKKIKPNQRVKVKVSRREKEEYLIYELIPV